MSRATSPTGFTRTDLLAALALSAITLIYGGSITGCGGGDSKSEPVVDAKESMRMRMLNGTQIRGLSQAMLAYAQSNKGWYPGLDNSGNNATARAVPTSQTPFAAAALSPVDPTAAVYAILFSGSYFSPDSALSPLEPKGVKTVSAPNSVVTKANYSYALLSVASPDADKGRRAEWSDTQNSQAPIAGDRSSAIDPSLKTTSLHVASTSADSANWQGSIVWNDNHVTFEETGKLKAAHLKIGKTADTQSTETDDLFRGAAVGKFDATTNALFAY